MDPPFREWFAELYMFEIVHVLQDTFDTMMQGVTFESEREKKKNHNQHQATQGHTMRAFAVQLAERQLRREIANEQHRVNHQDSGSDSDDDDSDGEPDVDNVSEGHVVM